MYKMVVLEHNRCFMANVKRTFTLPEDISEQLDMSIPNKERSKFIALSIRGALQERKRQAVLDALQNIQPRKIPEGKKGVIEALRDVRQSTFQELENS